MATPGERVDWPRTCPPGRVGTVPTPVSLNIARLVGTAQRGLGRPSELTTASIRMLTLTAAAQKLPAGRGRAAGWGRGGLLRLVEDQPSSRLPAAPGWVRLRPELAGICGSEVGVAHARSSFVLSANYTAERQILGHEVVAVVAETGTGVTGVTEGDRVVVDPVLS